MFGISSTEFAIILVFALLLFGPDKLPQMGKTIGRALRQFKETQEKLTAVVQTEVVDPMTEAATAPTKPKKSDDSTSEDVDSDADADQTGSAEPHRSETFAERRARLAAEKEQAETEAAGGAAAAATAAALSDDDGGDGAVGSEESVVDSDVEASEAAEPQVRTTQDLYARRPRKTKAAATEPEPAVDPFSAGDPDSLGGNDASDEDAEGGEQ